MSTNQEKLFGRLLLKNDILQLIKSTDKISVSKIFSNFLLEAKVNPILGMTSISSNKIKCNRCGTVHIKNSVKLPIGVLSATKEFPKEIIYKLVGKTDRESKINFKCPLSGN